MASVEEHARMLLALADDAPVGEVAELVTRLENWGARASEILGPTSSNVIMGDYVSNAINACTNLQEALGILQNTAREHANRYLGGGS